LAKEPDPQERGIPVWLLPASYRGRSPSQSDEHSRGKSHLWGGLVAATALEHGFTVATRNVKDFQRLALAIVNP
jgi:hypothetical protein